MDEFNNINNTEREETVNNPNPTDNGYTVTPDGGFYNKAHNEIIQDDIKSSSTNTDSFEYNQSINSYSNPYSYGNYGYYNQNNNNKPEKKPKTQRRYGFFVILLACVLSAVVGATTGAVISYFNLPEKTVIREKNNISGDKVNITVDETAYSAAEAVAKKVTPSVVGIRTTTDVMNFFGGSQEATGDGSGVIYSQDGYIITNYHVIADAVSYSSSSKIEVYLDSLDSEPYNASVVGYNISADLAVIKIEETGLTAIEFAKSSELKIGQYVITVGNPGGLEFMDSITYGIISGLNRVVTTDSNVALIQTDAAINPGNSGGALVNTQGLLVGINSAKIVSEEFEGMGFAIPSDTVKEICDNIIKNENSPEPYVGITISERYTSEVLDFYGFPNGAVVLSVAEGSPAANAGIKKGDIITEFAGTKIKEYQIFIDELKNCKPGDKVDIKIYRSGRYYTTKITIASNN